MLTKVQTDTIHEFMDIFGEAMVTLIEASRPGSPLEYEDAVDVLADVLLPRGYTVLDNADYARLAGDSHAAYHEVKGVTSTPMDGAGLLLEALEKRGYAIVQKDLLEYDREEAL